MSAATSEQQVHAARRLNRLVFIIPIIAGVLVIVLVALLAIPGSPLELQEDGSLSILADVLTICFGLCPLFLCLLPIYALLIGGVWGVNRASDLAAEGLDKAHDASQTMVTQTKRIADTANEKSIDFNTRMTFFNRLVNFFDRKPEQVPPQLPSQTEEDQSDAAK
jgi:hypothetical protein